MLLLLLLLLLLRLLLYFSWSRQACSKGRACRRRSALHSGARPRTPARDEACVQGGRGGSRANRDLVPCAAGGRSAPGAATGLPRGPAGRPVRLRRRRPLRRRGPARPSSPARPPAEAFEGDSENLTGLPAPSRVPGPAVRARARRGRRSLRGKASRCAGAGGDDSDDGRRVCVGPSVGGVYTLNSSNHTVV